MKPELIIVGAGLCGLYTAKLLEPYYAITILEARTLAGGRIRSIKGFDMGPSWVWSHHKHILKLIADLKLDLFSHYTHGHAMYDTTSGGERFSPPVQAPSARVKGGLTALVDRLVASLTSTRIVYDEAVRSISQKGEKLELKSSKGVYEASQVILALPPRVTLKLDFQPNLDPATYDILASTPTWMAHTAKCIITFERAFWIDQGLSGFGFSNHGPLSEIHDSSIEGKDALFGFFHSKAQADKDAVIRQLVRMFGKEAEDYSDFYLVDWRQEPFISSDLDGNSPVSHPNYGFERSHFEGKLYFSATESAFKEGGYLEGALIAAHQSARRLLEKL